MVGSIPKLSRYSQVKYKPLLEAGFLISNKCCDIMKKKPGHDYMKRTKSHPMLGTMADESLLRQNAWIRYGCNSFEGKFPSSKPMSFWTEQDVLRYIVDNNIAISSVYGEVVPDGDHDQITMLRNDAGQLMCTGCSRSGCLYCAFGLGSELLSHEGRMVRLARTHPKQYAYVMGGGAYDPEDGYWKPTKEGLGFAHVFDEINRLIPTKTGRPYIRYLPEGGEMDRAKKLAESKPE
jgi:3'-phosphoadenosine 5'-phosphosulfate sulfotransferase (PAPS reductase)/FAD synthetase